MSKTISGETTGGLSHDGYLYPRQLDCIRRPNYPLVHYHLAQAYERKGVARSSLGNKEQTLAWLERAYQQRVHNMIFLKVEPELDGLRSDPRFEDLLGRVGVPH